MEQIHSNENLLTNVEIAVSKEQGFQLLKSLKQILLEQNNDELLRILFHKELNGENLVQSFKIKISEINETDNVKFDFLKQKNQIIKFEVQADSTYFFEDQLDNIIQCGIQFDEINSLFQFRIDQLKMESVIREKKIGKVKLKYEKFLELVNNPSADLNSIFEQMLNYELFINTRMDSCFNDLIKTGKIDTVLKERLLLSEYCSELFSDMVRDSEDILLMNTEDFNKVIKSKDLSIESLLALVDRRKKEIFSNMEIVLLRELDNWMSAKNIEHFNVCDMVLNKKIVVSESDTLIGVFDENTFVNENKIVLNIVEKNKMSITQLISLAKLNETLKEGISGYIIKTQAILVEDPIFLLKIGNEKNLTEEAIIELTKRYEVNYSMEKQISIVVKYQRIVESGDKSLMADILDVFPDEIAWLSSLSKNCDDSISNEVFLRKHSLNECEFDSKLAPLVSKDKIRKLCFMMLEFDSASESVLQFIHEFDLLEFEFKISLILSHKKCPQIYIEKYIKQPLLFLSLLKNPFLSQRNLNFIFEQNMYGRQDLKVNEGILNHPNCSIYLKNKMIQGEYFLLNLIKQSSNEVELQQIMNDLIAYPNSSLIQYRLDENMVCLMMDEVVKNKYSNKTTLDLYSAYFDYWEDEEVCKLVALHKECSVDYLKTIINTNKINLLKIVIQSNKLNEDLVGQILNKRLNSLVFKVKNLQSAEFLNAGIDEVSMILLKDRYSLSEEFVKDFKRKLLFVKNNMNFLNLLDKYLKDNNYRVYGQMIPVSPGDIQIN